MEHFPIRQLAPKICKRCKRQFGIAADCLCYALFLAMLVLWLFCER